MEGFMTHCGSATVERPEVLAVPVPQHTMSYAPIGYGIMVEFIENQIKQMGLETISTAFALNRNGAHFFARWVLDTNSDKHGMSIVARQSYDKTMRACIAGGLQTFVCDNQSISGDFFKVMHKNTKNVWKEFRVGIMLELDNCLEGYYETERDLKSWDAVQLSEDNGYRELGLLQGRKLLTPNQASVVYDAWKKPEHEEQAERNLANLYQAVTVGLKKGPAATIPERHIAAHSHFRDLYLQG